MATLNVESIIKQAAHEIIKGMILAQSTTKRRGRPPGRTHHVRSAAPKKRKLSAAGRAAIRRAVKARWAKFHAQQKRKAGK